MRSASLLALSLALLVGCSADIGLLPRAPTPRGADVALEQSGEVLAPSRTAEVVEEVLPGVVNVRVTALTEDPFGRTVPGEGEGSGVVIDGEQGIIVTNNHVVRGALDVTVVFNDGRKLEGEVVGSSPDHDLAVVQVDAGNLTEVELGRSRALRLGDEVVAIGFPLGLGSATVTRGIISAKQRTIAPQGAEAPLQGLLQTDAAINPGNSGGALVDMAGRLVGINTAAAGAAQAENIGFAIAIDQAVPVIDEILSEPAEQRAWLGVSLATLEPSVAAQIGLDPDATGALVTDVFPGPAEEAGIEAGEVIVGVGEVEIEASEDVSQALTEYDPGDRVEVELLGADGTRTVTVELGQRPVDLE